MEPDYSIYETVKKLALQKREQYGVVTGQTNLSFIRRIYKAEGIHIHYCPQRLHNLRAAYFSDGGDLDVLLNKSLPDEAKIFSLVHELKHHYLDKCDMDELSFCLKQYGDEPLVEKSAEVFAAEFIWPESEFAEAIYDFGLNVGNCSPENIVRFKLGHAVPISYQFLKKRLKRLRIITDSSYDNVKFLKLQEEIYGKPYYKRY